MPSKITSPILTLNSGHKVPQVGFGLWKVPDDQCAQLVYEAIKSGYRLFDGAYDYGNEKEAGEGVRRAIKEGIVKREDIFITTKLWNTCHERNRAIKTAKEQVADWGLGYIDLYLIHFPIALAYNPEQTRGWYYKDTVVKLEPIPIRETWEALEQLHGEGLLRNIGLSNFNAQSIFDILTYAKVKPAMLQIEHHPYLTQPKLLELCNDEGILVTGYSSYGPQSFLELPAGFPTKALHCKSLFDNEIITKAAAKHKRSVGQVLLRWATQRGVCVIPKTNKAERLLENLNCCDFDLDKGEMDAISGLDMDVRFNDPATYLPGRPLRLFA